MSQHRWIDVLVSKWKAYQVEIILYKVLLESLYRERTMSHTFNKVVLGELFPHMLDIWTVQDVFKESATERSISKPFNGEDISEALLRCKRQSIH